VTNKNVVKNSDKQFNNFWQEIILHTEDGVQIFLELAKLVICEFR